ncbi:hypothetical protein [Amycolatopsis sp. NBC_01286]|uniref:hypothetical protein n=1 Tax=Amycolatopsis sp. NBC_01286 TaxID=2903560 RepID=UPI002E11D8A6|nr:hypothetical protein OG570_16945 [Amycolatopsis sp. NBC_01286]
MLEHGRWFTPTSLPPDRPRGEPQRCYRNASLHSETYGLVYVEGFAIHTSGFPAPHAWCARLDGTVEDPTWNTDGHAYLGLPFTADYLHDHETRAGMHTVLFDQHRTGWALLTHGVPANSLAPIGERADFGGFSSTTSAVRFRPTDAMPRQ